MSDQDDVLAAALARATALSSGDERALDRLLHPRFTWTSHKGERFDRARYLAANRPTAQRRWRGQQLSEPVVTVVGDAAVLCCVARDLVATGTESPELFVMPMTQTWVRVGREWQCLAGHAGPRLPDD